MKQRLQVTGEKLQGRAFSIPGSLSPGFTLLEVMIAMSILAVMSLLLCHPLNQTMSGKEDTEKKTT
jgi:prepilin-type N-terminal cleavage/methylation domain-containing protein